jgi:uncharacterized protein (DUF4415 family)
MNTGKKLTPEMIAELKKRPIDYSDIPQFTEAQLAQFKPAHPELFKTQPVKVPVTIKMDADILAWFKAGGKGYQTRINTALRNLMIHAQEV